ncbi:MAG: hypothetical protein Q9202_002371 [Teloschistes flavicans]
MDADAVLTEVVQSRPDLVLFRAVPGSTPKAPVGTVLVHHSVDTLLVPIQIILGAEARSLGASENIAFVWFLMSEQMLPGRLLLTIGTGGGSMHGPTCARTGFWKCFRNSHRNISSQRSRGSIARHHEDFDVSGAPKAHQGELASPGSCSLDRDWGPFHLVHCGRSPWSLRSRNHMDVYR